MPLGERPTSIRATAERVLRSIWETAVSARVCDPRVALAHGYATRPCSDEDLPNDLIATWIDDADGVLFDRWPGQAPARVSRSSRPLIATIDGEPYDCCGHQPRPALPDRSGCDAANCRGPTFTGG